MARTFLVLFVTALIAASTAVSASECAVEGIPERWALAACFAELETDDELHPGVIDCFNDWSQQRSGDACSENRASKRQLCEITVRYSDQHESVDACVADKTYIPAVVKEGVGG